MRNFKGVVFDQDGVLAHLLPFFSAAHAAVINICLQEFTGDTGRVFVTKNDLYLNNSVSGATFDIKFLETAKLNNVVNPESFSRYPFFQKLQNELLDVMLSSGVDGVMQMPYGDKIIASLVSDGVLHDGRVHIETFPGVFSTLNSLKENEIIISVGSTNPPSRVRNALTATELLPYFQGDRIFGADDAGIRGKPAPDVYLAAISKLEGKPVSELSAEDKASYIAVEDSISGVQAAKAAGMYIIGIAQDPAKNPATEEFNLKSHGADVVYFHFSMVGAHLRQVFDVAPGQKPSVTHLSCDNIS